MTILHFKVVLAAIFIKININNRKIRPYCQFYSLITSKCVPLLHGKLGCVYAVTIYVYTSTEGRKLSSPRHFKMRNGLCRPLFSTKQMLPWHI